MSARASNLLLRGGVVLIMAMFIGAPTPGYVQGCSSDATSAVDPEEHCRVYNEIACARDRAAGRIDESERQACVAQIPAMCSGVNFPVGCSPSRSSVDACYEAMRDLSRLSIDDTALPECQAICGGSGGGVDPEGI